MCDLFVTTRNWRVNYWRKHYMYDMITYTYFCLCGKTNCRDVYRNSFIRPLLFLEKVFGSHFDAPKKARLFIIFWLCRQKFVGRGKFRKQLAKRWEKIWIFTLHYVFRLIVSFGIYESLAILSRTCFNFSVLVVWCDLIWYHWKPCCFT